VCYGRIVGRPQIHHKVRIADGGTNDRSNLQVLCEECHRKVHDDAY